MRHLAKSVLSCVLLLGCSLGSYESLGEKENVVGAARWASYAVIVSACYYMQFQLWRRFWQRKRSSQQYRRTRTVATVDPGGRGGEEDVELDSLPPVSEEEAWIDGGSIVSNGVYYPELTMSSVWTYVYGWGLMLFVCVYCLAGVDVPSSCWWVMGMLALSFDELISRGTGRWVVGLVGLCLCLSVFSVWSGALMDNKGNFVGDLMFAGKGNIPALDFVVGVVLPVATPFIFFTVRSTVRSVTQDVYRLCEFALPFMTVLAVCFLAATSGMCYIDTRGLPDRRDLGNVDLGDSYNSSKYEMVETVAKFASSYATHIQSDKSGIVAMQRGLLFLAPFLAFWLIRVLVLSVITGYATEFITGFILVTATRFGMTHAVSVWSVLAVSGAGCAFIVLLATGRRV